MNPQSAQTNMPTTPDATPDTKPDTSQARDMIRHALATLAYRAAKAARGAPSEFQALRVGPTSRTPGEILAHMGDLMDWALTMAQDRTAWHEGPVRSWDADVERFFDGISALDAHLATTESPGVSVLQQLLQGPIADALTHTGQLTLLRRLAQAPIRGESYQRALIAAGQTRLEQPAPQREFD